MQLPHILIVDDDDQIRDLLGRYLSNNGFLVSEADDAEQARSALDIISFNAIILDIMMPKETGLELLPKLQSQFQGRQLELPPILMLTAMGETSDKIVGLEAGVDDYLAKPFEPQELLLRLKAILRRTYGRRANIEAQNSNNETKFGDCVFDNSQLALFKNGERVHLTTSEEKLLQILIENRGETLSREYLASISGTNERTIDVQITRLRKKIEKNPKRAVYLQTIRGEGYVMRI